MRPAGSSITAIRQRIARCVRGELGVEPGPMEQVAGGLGQRCFFRVTLPGSGTNTPTSLIARFEMPEDPRNRPAGLPPEPALEPLRAYLAEQGLPVPARYGGLIGLELLEDLGSLSLQRAAAERNGTGRRALYREATALVPKLQALPAPRPPLPSFTRHLDTPYFCYKAELFIEHSLPLALGREANPDEVLVVREAFALVEEQAAAAPQRLAHRDFQSSNLYLCPHAGGERLVMIDFQGALLAPPEYDLVCLLRDSYVELPWEEVSELLEGVRPRLPDAPDPERFLQRFHALTLTRKGKDHARFLYAAQERGDRRFQRFLPATTRALQRAARESAARDPRFADLASLIARLPESEERGSPCVR